MTEKALRRIEQEKRLKTGELDLKQCELAEIPKEVNQLTWLETLDLSFNKITEIQNLDKLSNLTLLDLSFNQITVIKNLDKLNNLSQLELSYNQITTIQNLDKLNNLSQLDLSYNQITAIQNLDKLNNLSQLDFSYNQITTIQNLDKLNNLNHLDLAKNQITQIHNLDKLNNINHLDLAKNRIKSLSGLIGILKNISIQVRLEEYFGYYEEAINLYNNPIKEPPIDIVEKGRDAVLLYLEQQAAYGTAPLYESKLMILGQGGVGKTTFAKLQTDPKYIVKEDTGQSTLGINIYKNKEYAHTENPEVNIKAHLWDFGGQEIQKMLHQFFITQNCLYVIVSDKRQENTNFNYWFQIVELLGPNSHVLVLENPKNTAFANEAFPISKYQGAFPKLSIQNLEVNLAETRGVDSTVWKYFNELIAQKLSNLEIVNREVIATWRPIRQKLDQLTAKYITFDDYYKTIANEVELNGEIKTLKKEEAKQCLGYLRDLGDLTYFDEQGLSNFIFLDHNWLTEGLYFILSDKAIEKSYGTFTRQQAFAKWEQEGYSEAEKEMLLSLLLKNRFDICYQAPNQTDIYLTPLLLQNARPEGNKWHYETNLWFKYQYDFMPHGLFSRFIVQVHERIHEQIQWKNGVWLHDDKDEPQTFAEVLAIDHPNRAIEIKIHGLAQDCKQMLEYVDKALDNLHQDFKNLQVQKMAACVCPTCKELIKNGEKPYFHSFTRIAKRLENNEYTTECGKSGKNVDISDILLDLGLKKEKEGQDLKQTFNFLKELEMSINNINIHNDPRFYNKQENNNSSNSSSSAQSSSEANVDVSVNISVHIEKVTGNLELIERGIDRNKDKLLNAGLDQDDINDNKEYIDEVKKDFKELEEKGKKASPGVKTSIGHFIDDLGNEKSKLHKTLKTIRKGRDYGVDLAEAYNTIAQNIGMPSIPPAALAVIKKL